MDQSAAAPNSAENWKEKYEKLELKLRKKAANVVSKVEFEKLSEKNMKNELTILKMKSMCEKKDEDLVMKGEAMSEIKEKLRNLTSRLEERVKCPVCLDVPTTGPIYNCPKGHCICSSCYRGFHSQCPMCRTHMYQQTSLLAVTVIENIDHLCVNEGCEVRVALEKTYEHKRSCDLRPVTCPAHACKKTIPYSKLIEHTKICLKSMNKFNVQNSQYHMPYFATTKSNLLNSSFHLPWLRWKNKDFFLTVKGEGSFMNFYLQMLGSENECEKCEVMIEVTNLSKDQSYTFHCKPFSIDMTEDDKKEAGLVIMAKAFQALCEKMSSDENKMQFTVNVDFKK